MNIFLPKTLWRGDRLPPSPDFAVHYFPAAGIAFPACRHPPDVEHWRLRGKRFRVCRYCVMPETRESIMQIMEKPALPENPGRGKMRRLLTCAIMICSGTLWQAASADAADPAFCRNYTKAALNQVRGALADPRCAVGISGSRWSTAFPVHYEWCLGASFEATGAERDARTSYLKSCR